nr:MAG TPA: hypothetical protein [Caudoviricetes sp.]
MQNSTEDNAHAGNRRTISLVHNHPMPVFHSSATPGEHHESDSSSQE